MAYYAVDDNGAGYVYSDIPVRNIEQRVWELPGGNMESLEGDRIFGVNIEWEDDPIEIRVINQNEEHIKTEAIGNGNGLDAIHEIQDFLVKKSKGRTG